MTFEEPKGKTKMTLRHVSIPSGTMSDMTQAKWNKSFDKLAECLQWRRGKAVEREHPIEAEIAAVRTIILKANRQVTEAIKWGAPSFYYQGDMAVFNPGAREHLHVVFPTGIDTDDGPARTS